MKSNIKIKFYFMACSIIFFSNAGSCSNFEGEEMLVRPSTAVATRQMLPITSHEVPSKVGASETNWRKNWFVKNVIVEIPIIGDCFYDSHVAITLKRVGKSTVMLVGGGLGMMVLDKDMSGSHNMAIQVSKATASMAFGMMTAAIIYNTFISLGTLVKNRLCSRDGTELVE